MVRVQGGPADGSPPAAAADASNIETPGDGAREARTVTGSAFWLRSEFQLLTLPAPGTVALAWEARVHVATLAQWPVRQ